jgi:hypothetical protein
VISSGDKGKRAELALAQYLRSAGWPDAERSVVTGFKASTREVQDAGDISGTPYTWQVKHYSGGLSDEQVLTFMAEARAQAAQARTRLGILVERRDGKADPAQWWAWLRTVDLGLPLGVDLSPFVHTTPVRMHVGGLVACLPRTSDLPRG